MNLTSLLILAQAATPAAGTGQPPSWTMLPYLIFIFAIFYFLMIRPQQKRQKEHEKLVSSVKTGDRVITSSGIHGMVANVKDKTVIVKVADNVKIEFDRAAIVSIAKDEEAVVETKA